jgi:hypothetical protein
MSRGEPLEPAEPAKADKLPVPGPGSTNPKRRQWLQWAASITEGKIGDVVRYGGVIETPLTIEIKPPGGGEPTIVRFPEERDIVKHQVLRTALIGQGGVQAERITNGKIAGDFYYVLCSLADIVAPVRALDEMQEWCDGCREEATRLDFDFSRAHLFNTLGAMRDFPYSRRDLDIYRGRKERCGPGDVVPAKPKPPLFIDPDGGEWISVTHLGTYVRHGREHHGVINNKALAAGVVELGGRRWKADAWDKTTRGRVKRTTTVLLRLPKPKSDPSDPEGDPDV